MNDIEENKPRKWLLIILILIAIIISVILLNKVITERKTNNKNSWSIFDIFNIKDSSFATSISTKAFNSKYERYTGNESGFFLEDLFENVITNNKTNQKHKIKIIYGEINTQDPEEIKQIKQKIESRDEFEVSLNYDENGFVNEIVLEILKKDNSKINAFNSSFNFMYNGTEYGSSIKNLIDKVITNNQTNQNHILTIIFNNINSSDVEIIRSIKKEIDDWTEYEIIYDYNEEGYIYQIKIEK